MMKPLQFMKRPIVIQAMQYTERSHRECIAWCGARHLGIDEDGAEYETANLFIATLEGEMLCKLGDWIIKGVKGEFYPCKPDIFDATYESAEP
jgi:hypothetical protein